MSLRCRMDFKNFWNGRERERERNARGSTINPKIQLQLRTSRLFHIKCHFLYYFLSRAVWVPFRVSVYDNFSLSARWYFVRFNFNFCPHRSFILPLKFNRSLFYSPHVRLGMDFDWIMPRLLHLATNPAVIIRNVIYSRNAYLSRAYNR